MSKRKPRELTLDDVERQLREELDYVEKRGEAFVCLSASETRLVLKLLEERRGQHGQSPEPIGG